MQQTSLQSLRSRPGEEERKTTDNNENNSRVNNDLDERILRSLTGS